MSRNYCLITNAYRNQSTYARMYWNLYKRFD